MRGNVELDGAGKLILLAQPWMYPLTQPSKEFVLTDVEFSPSKCKRSHCIRRQPEYTEVTYY